jgi:hypothetical protein
VSCRSAWQERHHLDAGRTAHVVWRNELIQPGAKKASKETQGVAGTFRFGRMLAMLRGPAPWPSAVPYAQSVGFLIRTR